MVVPSPSLLPPKPSQYVGPGAGWGGSARGPALPLPYAGLGPVLRAQELPRTFVLVWHLGVCLCSGFCLYSPPSLLYRLLLARSR